MNSKDLPCVALVRGNCTYEELPTPYADESLSGIWSLFVRGKKMVTEEGALAEFSAALQFPHYFGNNWNALEDCLGDLAWIPAQCIHLWILDSDSVLSREAASAFRMLLEILVSASDELDKSDELRPRKRLTSVLHSLPAKAAILEGRLSLAQIQIPRI